MKYSLKTLELDLILEQVSQTALTATAKNKVLTLMPSADFIAISNMLNETLETLNLTNRFSRIPLVPNFDIYSIIQQLRKEINLNLADVLQLLLYLNMEQNVIDYFKTSLKNNFKFVNLQRYPNLLFDHLGLINHIKTFVDSNGVFLDDATVELKSIRQNIHKNEYELNTLLQKLVGKYHDYLNDFVLVIRNDRHCLAVKESFKNKIKGVTHDVSASKQTVYIEPSESYLLATKLERLKRDEYDEQMKILGMISSHVILSLETINANLDLLVELDVLSAKANYAVKIDGYLPNLNQTGETSLVKARHPLIDPKEVVPISISVDSKHPTLLITGPNTGGKTAALKTIGLLTLMTQSGLLIPASETTKISVYDKVYADIGDDQSLVQSLSTFSSHMKKIINIIDNADEKSLVLLDELGSGTDPTEGVALAIAIMNNLREKKTRLVVTTHYSELKSFAYEHANIMTASVMFDQATLKPLYEISMGTTGSSHALLISENLGLDEKIIKDATSRAKRSQTDLSKAIEKLSIEKQSLEKEKIKYLTQMQQAKEETIKYEKLQRELIERQKEIIEKVEISESKKWHELNQIAKDLVSTLEKKKSLSFSEAADYKNQINQKVPSTKIRPSKYLPSQGDLVFISSYQQTGSIIKVGKTKSLVRFGVYELEFLNDELMKVEEPTNTESNEIISKRSNFIPTTQVNAITELDLRGKRYEEVSNLMSEAVDSLLLNNLRTLRVIHGFGTGAVRKAVETYLKNNSLVKSHRLGGEGEGLAGVTIITLN